MHPCDEAYIITTCCVDESDVQVPESVIVYLVGLVWVWFDKTLNGVLRA